MWNTRSVFLPPWRTGRSPPVSSPPGAFTRWVRSLDQGQSQVCPPLLHTPTSFYWWTQINRNVKAVSHFGFCPHHSPETLQDLWISKASGLWLRFIFLPFSGNTWHWLISISKSFTLWFLWYDTALGFLLPTRYFPSCLHYRLHLSSDLQMRDAPKFLELSSFQSLHPPLYPSHSFQWLQLSLPKIMAPGPASVALTCFLSPT